MPLGQLLIQHKLITEEQLDSALAYQQKIGGRIGAILVKLSYIEENLLIRFLSEHERLPMVDLTQETPHPDAVKALPQELIERLEVVPLRKESGRLVVAMSDPTNFDEIDEMRMHSGLPVETVLAAPTQIRHTLQRLFAPDPAERPTPATAGKQKKRYGLSDLVQDLERGARPEQTPPAAEPALVISEERKLFNRADAKTLLGALTDALLEKGILTEAELAQHVRSRLAKKGIIDTKD